MGGRWFEDPSWGQLFVLGAFIRLAGLCWGALQDAWFSVRYTDIDYFVFADGARLVWEGESCFARATYRYTPLLAYALVPTVWMANFGKVLFVVADLWCAHSLRGLCTGHLGFSERSSKLRVCVAWLLNPFVVNISTRGNSESLTLALLLSSLSHLLAATNVRRGDIQWRPWILSAAALGLAAHVRLFPVLHGIPIALFLWKSGRGVASVFSYGGVALVTLGAATWLSFALEGDAYVSNALVYHAARSDHRHSLSLAFPALYLNPRPGPFLVIPQAFASLLPSVALFCMNHKRANLSTFVQPLCSSLALQTIVMVAFSRVLTVQYFAWWLPYLALLPVRKIPVRGICLWLITFGTWMGVAYALEFRGASWAIHLLGPAGWAFFLAQCHLISSLLARS